MADIRINQLPAATGGSAPVATDNLAIDGASTRRATIQQVVDTGAPIANQTEAQTGTNATKRMTPLTTKQSIASEVGVTLASAAQGVLADTALQDGDPINGAYITDSSVTNTKLSTVPAYTIKGNSTNSTAQASDLPAGSVRGLLWELRGFNGDGITDDTSNFSVLETSVSGQEIDLQGKTYAVTSIPSGNLYINGYWRGDYEVPSIGIQTIPSVNTRSLLSSNVDTGGVGSAYSGGVEGTPTVPGRTNQDLYFLLASQGSRADGPARAGVIAGIYSRAAGNLSLILAGRQSRAMMPQTFMLGTEECQADTGSRGGAIASYGSFAEGVGAAVVSGRSSRASGWESAVVGSNSSIAGYGRQPRFLVNINGAGQISSVTILDGGAGLPASPTYEITDRRGSGTGGAVTLTITSGVVTAVAVTSPGSNYSQIANAVNLHLFLNRSMVVAGSVSSSAKGSQSFVGGSSNSETLNNQSGVLFSNRSTASGINSGVIASGPTSGGSGTTDCVASGDNSAVIAAGSSLATGQYSLATGAINTASGLRSTVFGRRTENNQASSVAIGDNGAGGASPANRKFHALSNGALQIAGTLTQNNVFTDIAKMFENIVYEPIPVGSLVAWDGRKVRLTKEDDLDFSVHSRTYSILLGDSSFTWSGRYFYDEFGEVVMGDVWDEDEQKFVIGPVENPDFDITQENIARSERRDEWTPVCLTGEVHTRVDASVSVNDWVKPSSIEGLGTKSAGRSLLRCMEVKTPYNEEKGYAIALCLKQ